MRPKQIRKVQTSYGVPKGTKSGQFIWELWHCEIERDACSLLHGLGKTRWRRYKTTSFDSIRHGINRYLKSPPHDKKFDVVKDSDFTDANTNFRAVMSEFKRMGLAEIDHHPVINEPDRDTLYTSMFMCTDTPSVLAKKVHYYIRMYFFVEEWKICTRWQSQTLLYKSTIRLAWSTSSKRQMRWQRITGRMIRTIPLE